MSTPSKNIAHSRFFFPAFRQAYINDLIDWRYLPYIRPIYVRPMFQGISPQNMGTNGTVHTFLDPDSSIDIVDFDGFWKHGTDYHGDMGSSYHVVRLL